MTRLAIVRTRQEWPILQSVLDAIGGFLFGVLDGLSRDDKSKWRRVWNHIKRMECGEILWLDLIFPRNPIYHRKFFALLNVGFDAWEPPRQRKNYKGKPVAKNFDQFREDITILAGFYEQTFDIRGRMKLKAKSISFSNMDQVEFEAVYGAVADVLLQQVLTTYAGREELDAVVDRILEFVEP